MRLGAAKKARESAKSRDEFEAPDINPVFLDKDQAINSASPAFLLSAVTPPVHSSDGRGYY